jgi:hypothetical protein
MNVYPHQEMNDVDHRLDNEPRSLGQAWRGLSKRPDNHFLNIDPFVSFLVIINH